MVMLNEGKPVKIMSSSLVCINAEHIYIYTPYSSTIVLGDGDAEQSNVSVS